MEKVAMITVYNKGLRTYHVPDHDATAEEKVQGKVIMLYPGKSVSLPEPVARELMTYSDIVDITTMQAAQGAKAAVDSANLKKAMEENEALKKKVAELEGDKSSEADSGKGSKTDKDKKTSKGK